MHGSLARDFDLIAIAWVETPSPHEAVIEEMLSTFAVQQIDDPEERAHGRLAYFLSVGFGECAIDLSFFPAWASARWQAMTAVVQAARQECAIWQHELIAALDRLAAVERGNEGDDPCAS